MVASSIVSREARFAYVAFAFRLAEIYVPFVRHAEVSTTLAASADVTGGSNSRRQT
jgi:hypothetical protein